MRDENWLLSKSVRQDPRTAIGRDSVQVVLRVEEMIGRESQLSGPIDEWNLQRFFQRNTDLVDLAFRLLKS